ncbi:hypothetical protein GCM10010124_07830 [Pilimelia terevasa]|uniref:Lipoprotein n=1 Tax=Pilimelia terevasa TaxID=53372 RepID=A0A8J3FEX0_9ACTN|nr:hypothetical protein [Pilimelia terevasa]GGK17716.1 hypothetical protein GCM10010124_07830 [Pilimelia terevasa]
MDRIDRRLTRPAVLLLASALLATLGACGDGGRGAGQTAGRLRTPQEALRAAAPDQDTAFRYTLSDADSTGAGAREPAAGRGYAEFSPRADGDRLVVQTRFLKVDKDLWTRITASRKITGFDVPSTWLRIDPAKVTRTDLLAEFAGDPTGATALLAHTGEVVGEGAAYRGTVDLVALADPAVVPAETVAALGPAAAAVPFVAEVDDQNRLSRLELKVPAAGRARAYSRVATYSGYGAPDVPAAPAAAADAPGPVYDLLNE